MLGNASLRFRRVAMRVFNRSGTPQRVARGMAAGFFAAAVPLAGVRVVVSLLVAWLIRGSKVYALATQALLSWLLIVPLTRFECWLGDKVWNPPLPTAEASFGCARRAAESWEWLNPFDSMRHAIDVYAAQPAVLGPLTLGVLYTGMLGAAIAYPFGAILASEYYAYRLRRRARRGMQIMPPRGRLTVPTIEQTSSARGLSSAEGSSENQTTPPTPPISPFQRGENGHYLLRPEQCVTADSVSLLFDGRQAYPEMLRAIADATETIDLETYILCDDRTGRRFAEALAAAARRGVRTRLLFDAVGALGLPASYIAGLVHAGVQVGIFRPLSSLWQRGFGPFNRRDHRKIMIVDGRIGFIGGLNICDDNAPKIDGGMGWRDTHLRIEGAVVAKSLRSLFEETWVLADVLPLLKREGGESSAGAGITKDGLTPPTPPFQGGKKFASVAVQVLGNKEFLQRVRLRRAYVHAIRRAQRYILIENAYFIPDRGIRRALYQAVQRGVVVAAVVAMYSDVKVAALASRSLYSELITGGVRLFEYPISMMHSKVAVVDDCWSMVASYNLDHRSLMHNLEAGVMAVDGRVAAALRERILADIELSREVTREFHDARPWDHVLMEALAYQVRYWL